MSKLADLEGKNVATITGFSFIPELEKIKDIQAVRSTTPRTQRCAISCAGRVDAVIADPPVMGYAIAQKPRMEAGNSRRSRITIPTYPMLTGKGRQFVLGVNMENKQLVEDMNKVLAGPLGRLHDGKNWREIRNDGRYLVQARF